jgi:hypothetical protein
MISMKPRIVQDGYEIPKQGVCHTVALPFILKSILRQNTSYGNSDILPRKNIIFLKINPLKDIITL